MKQIVLENKEVSIIDINNITNNSFVGIIFDNNKKCVVSKKGDSFVGILSDDTEKSLNHCWTEKSKKKFIEEAFNQKGTKAFVFETFGELCKWLIS